MAGQVRQGFGNSLPGKRTYSFGRRAGHLRTRPAPNLSHNCASSVENAASAAALGISESDSAYRA